MNYITEDYYKNEYMGVTVPASDLPRYIRRASEAIDSLTHYRINDSLLSAYPFIQEQIKKATAAQVEFLSTNGELAGTVVEKNGGFSIGKFSEQAPLKSDAGKGPQLSDRYALTVIDYLSPTGLLYSGVRTVQRRVY